MNDFKVGDRVVIAITGTSGTVCRVSDDKKECVVEFVDGSSTWICGKELVFDERKQQQQRRSEPEQETDAGSTSK